MKKIKKVKSNYNQKSLDNLVQNNKKLSSEQKEEIIKDSAKMRTKSFRWKIILNLPKLSENQTITDNSNIFKIFEGSSLLHKLEGYGFDYYAIFHDKDTYIDDDGISHDKTLHCHLILDDRKYKLNTTTKAMLEFLSKLFLLPKDCISIEPCHRLNSDIGYLVHALDKDKYQYDMSKIITNRRANCNYIICKCLQEVKNDNKIEEIEFEDLNYYIYDMNCSFRDLTQLLSKDFIQKNAYIINCLIAERNSQIYQALGVHNKAEEKYKSLEQYQLEIALKGSKKLKV